MSTYVGVSPKLIYLTKDVNYLSVMMPIYVFNFITTDYCELPYQYYVINVAISLINGYVDLKTL